MTCPLYRRSDAGELEALPPNPRSYDVASAHEARDGSEALLAAITAANGAEPTTQPGRTRTFEEQLRLVAEGRARVVSKLTIPQREYSFTVAGVSEPL
jgi:hypothetical protein